MDATPPSDAAVQRSVPPPAPKLLLQVIQQPNGEIQIISPLNGAAVTEILIKLLPGCWDAAKSQVKEKATKLVKPSPSIIQSLRNRLHTNNGRVAP